MSSRRTDPLDNYLASVGGDQSARSGQAASSSRHSSRHSERESEQGSVRGSEPGSVRGSEPGSVRGSERGYDGGSERGYDRGPAPHADWSTGRNSHRSVGAQRDRPPPQGTLRPPDPRGPPQRPTQQGQPPPRQAPPRQPPPPRLGPPGQPPPRQGPPPRQPPPQTRPPPAIQAPPPPRHTQIHRLGEQPRSMPPIVEEPASRTNTANSTGSHQVPPPRRDSQESARLMVMDVTDYANRQVMQPNQQRPAPSPGRDNSSQTELLIVAVADQPRIKTPKTPENMSHKGINTERSEKRRGKKRQKVVTPLYDDDDLLSSDSDLDFDIDPIDPDDLPMTDTYFRYARGAPKVSQTWRREDYTAVVDKYMQFPLSQRAPPAAVPDQGDTCAHCRRQYPAASPAGVVKIQRAVGRRQIYWFESKAMQGPGGCPHQCCGCCQGEGLTPHRRSMAMQPENPVIDIGKVEDDPHLNNCFCGRPNSPEMLSDSTYMGYTGGSTERRGIGPPIYPINTHHDVFVPGPSALFQSGGVFDRDEEDSAQDYRRFLQTHRGDEPLAVGEYDPSILESSAPHVMSDDVMFANHNYHQAIEKLNQHITNIDNVGSRRQKTVTFSNNGSNY